MYFVISLTQDESRSRLAWPSFMRHQTDVDIRLNSGRRLNFDQLTINAKH